MEEETEYREMGQEATGDRIRAGTGRKYGKIGLEIGTRPRDWDSRTGDKKGDKSKGREGDRRQGEKRGQRKVRKDWRWEKRGRRTGKKSKGDRDRIDEVVDRNKDGDSQKI